MQTVVVSNLSKRYAIGRRRDSRSTLVAALCAKARDMGKRLVSFGDDSLPSPETMHWALKDISFSLNAGDRLGIIGRNGAGKSTLLKVLSRITRPTSGEFALRGRVANLLEVGTGFHPDLTGRENIYLNGAILGMSRRNIQRYFDAIIDFSGIELYLDTPVKHYSSGMYMRLAFAVAAHLDSEILIVDEVLAVGDAEFQRKCLTKMGEASSDGRTVLFVSHNASAVARLCNRGLYLADGRVVADGPVDEILALYHKRNQGVQGIGTFDLTECEKRFGSGEVRFTQVCLSAKNESLEDEAALHWGDYYDITVTLQAEASVRPIIAIIIYDDLGQRIIDANTAMSGLSPQFEATTTSSFHFRLENIQLKPGRYQLGLWAGILNQDMDSLPEAISFVVETSSKFRAVVSYPGAYLCKYSIRQV